MASTLVISSLGALRERYRLVRRRSLELCTPLTPEDMMVQSCPEASPAKWHLAHTAWFFESFILREFLPDYRLFDANFPWLFNSYYQTFAEFPDKRLRASFSRPSSSEVLLYRRHVDIALETMLETLLDPGFESGFNSGHASHGSEEVLRRIELGLNHEEQHQELLLTDIHHAFFTNPLQPAYLAAEAGSASTGTTPLRFHEFPGGLVEIGADLESGFSFDNEQPRHKVWLEPYRLASRLVTCGEYAEFLADDAYSRPELWLSAGWQAIQDQRWTAPLYWRRHEGEWTIFTLRGKRSLSDMASAPVSHMSYFEADAYARWAGYRLATEAEWESAAVAAPVGGNLLDSGEYTPKPQPASPHSQLFGDCWQWTASAYLGYPGFQPLSGSLGEYNGKFMSGQMVLRGGSCVTPASHIRASYRNFFPPETRWQFSGIRLAQS
jgi:ergothioneine biosynthesis protein EgtB